MKSQYDSTSKRKIKISEPIEKVKDQAGDVDCLELKARRGSEVENQI